MAEVRVVLICCEGEETEPRYFEAVKRQYRIPQGTVSVKVLGGQGQHERLIDNSIAQRNELANKLKVGVDEIEIWAVCDKDNMSCTYDELLRYATKVGVNLAFCNPSFEIYLLQHFGYSASNETGRALSALLTKKLGKKYDKTDLSWFVEMIDQKPKSLTSIVAQCNGISDPANTPFITVHLLVSRLLGMAPKV